MLGEEAAGFPVLGWLMVSPCLLGRRVASLCVLGKGGAVRLPPHLPAPLLGGPPLERQGEAGEAEDLWVGFVTEVEPPIDALLSLYLMMEHSSGRSVFHAGRSGWR